ncbi:membrane fusion protein, multidrug efflux system [Cruoricaptor ignavus]|uniref:Membrane fusion protein, multidrug efflux system n=1 Tax=Cruoricaptor ignavus TaxID=1118202 RepID=A0A1M6CHE3_9FLAO|nr:HlyD family secretion protein [Cruoricaptor ignavus]SHI60439.1 membrane fusion protein, multidrug efflux system [Cruoricaptor ignavus]
MEENIQNQSAAEENQPVKEVPVAEPIASKPKKKNTNKSASAKKAIVNAVILTLIGVGLYYTIRAFRGVDNGRYTNAAQVEAFINPVNTRVSAYIKDIRFNEHQQVKAGDTLIILDDREIQTQVGQAEAALMAANAARNSTSASVRTASNNVNTIGMNAESAKANIQAAKARLWNAEQNYKRYQNLLQDEAVTRQQFDQVKSDYEAQRAQLEAQISQYQSVINSQASSRLQVNEVESKIGLNDAEIKRAQNALDMAKLNLSYTVITAPHDGVMGRRTVNVGQLLSPGQQVATIVDNRNMWVTANYREKQMENVKIGGLAEISVDALGGKVFEGKVTAISGATGAKYSNIPVDNSTGNFVKVQQRIPVRIEFTNKNKPEDLRELRAGMNVGVTLKQ